MSQKNFLVGTFVVGAVFTSLLAILQAQSQVAPQATRQIGKQQTVSAHDSQLQGINGQRIWEENCSRCHAAPEGFSPRISGTIVRHMRVRASLSQHDEEELLRFLNP
jgi:cytochrome c5